MQEMYGFPWRKQTHIVSSYYRRDQSEFFAVFYGNIEYIKTGNFPRLELIGYKISFKKLVN